MPEAALSSDSRQEHPPLHLWSRFVAMGDSFTEGIGDPHPDSPGGNRGWADRVAEELASEQPDFAYANLAIRGRLLNQIIDEQLEPALALKPDLVTICAGGNDVIRPGGDPDRLAERMDGAVARLRAAGAGVVLFTGPDLGSTPVLGSVRGRAAIYNENLRTVAQRHGAIIADMWALRELNDPQMWAPDRLHFSPLGHHTIAAMVLDTLQVPHSLQPLETKPLPAKKWRTARSEDMVWAREFLFPWVVRRVRHQSSGDGISAKRPEAGPMFGQRMPQGSAD
ncbi:SGNH/GDSL hydrolase family protein [Arthrobacter sp. zg-Y769]|uniref:SGNH/GDSL hydrolase family protein n=1 Tax=Arthrobacter sp. zg-Y769 TaxID=2894191 RepID=UPI001E4B769D|nr:SGNH/GDSL hydrolase family protein [Arthrobacter sp. zg-Y769]MCC9206095.1 SGNH/GDSL hydrolase family protein [Arthrobacter sp. zg-Y769]